MNKVKVLLFDFSGVIAIDGFWDWMGKNISNIEEYRNYFKEKAIKWDKGDISIREEVKKFGERVNVPFIKVWQGIVGGFKANEGMLEFISSLKPKYKIVILSNFPRELFNELIKKFSLTSYFDGFIISSDYHLIKPDPKFYMVALSKLQIKKDECFFIDDKMENVNAAQKLGIKSILYKDSDQCTFELKKLDISG